MFVMADEWLVLLIDVVVDGHVILMYVYKLVWRMITMQLKDYNFIGKDEI